MSSDPLNEASDWKCNKCSAKMTLEEVQSLTKDLEDQVEKLPLEKEVMEEHLKKLETILHQSIEILKVLF